MVKYGLLDRGGGGVDEGKQLSNQEDTMTEDPTPEPSPVGPPAPHEPPQSPLHGWTDSEDEEDGEPRHEYSATRMEPQQQRHYHEQHRTENIFWRSSRNSPIHHDPKEASRNEEESFSSFPSAPSPPTSQSGSMLYNRDRVRRNTRKRDSARAGKSSTKDSPPVELVQIKSQQQSSAKYEEDDSDTFYDDRSLELRLHQVLNRKPSFTPNTLNHVSTNLSPKSAKSANASSFDNVLKRTNTKKFDNNQKVSESDDSSDLPGQLDPVLEHDDVNISAGQLKRELERLSLAIQDLTKANERFFQKGEGVMVKDNGSKEDKTTDTAQNKEECMRLSHELIRIQTILEEEKEISASKILELTENKKLLEEGITKTTERVTKLEQEKLLSDQTILSLSKENEEYQNELCLIKEENASLKQAIESLESSLQNETSEKSSAMDRIQELNNEIASFQQQIDTLVGRESQSMAEVSKLRDENNMLRETINGLRKELGAANERISELRMGDVGKKYEVRSPRSSTLVPVDSESQDGSRTTVEEKKDDLLGDERVSRANPSSSTAARRGRLSRIKDATERAALIREHQKEIAQLISEHDAEMKRVTLAFNEIRERHDTAAYERVNDVERQISAAFELQRADLEKKHELELKKLKENADLNAANAAKSIESALTKVACVEKRYEHEARRREELEAEKKYMEERHAREMQTSREYWESEKDIMISEIKRECNFVFESSKSWTPKSEATSSLGFFSHRQEAVREEEGSQSLLPSIVSTSPKDSNSGNSQLLSSDLGQSLRETEALVESILNKPLSVVTTT
mmetsp:Transcript_7625/g.10855  ORF Transcript_7625/g.10855 Transcript_7625/m.10855 type:complete len:806 (+) Transcript_7625:159-2576(+)